MGTGPETRAVRLPRSDEPFLDQHAEPERRRLQELHHDATGEGAAIELSQDAEDSAIAWLEKDAERFKTRAAPHPHRGPASTLPPAPVRPPTDTGRI
jgi:hypothetical protein